MPLDTSRRWREHGGDGVSSNNFDFACLMIIGKGLRIRLWQWQHCLGILLTDIYEEKRRSKEK
jgi:hypothetical protein